MVTETKIPKGYKQTDVGIIPDDWDVKELGKVITLTQLGGNYPNSEAETSFPLIKMGNISRDHINLSKIEYIQEGMLPSEKDKLIFGDILFNTRNTLELVGKVAIWRNELPVAFFNSNLMRIRFISSLISSNLFMNYIFNSRRLINRLGDIATGTTSVAAIYGRDLFKIQVQIPKPEEQSSIAIVLSDVDFLITNLEELISKKLNIKQGAMQELLTGKKRLPGFSGEWEENSFGNLIELNKGEQLNKSELTLTGEYPDLNGGIEPSGYTNKWNVAENTITISEGGNSCGFVNLCKQKFWCGGHCYALKITSLGLNRDFLYQLLKLKEKLIMSLRIGSGLPNIQKKNLNEFSLFIPSEEKEQTAIAQVLSDMDTNIEELEQKLDKYKMIKQGMMQELLTGRTRLI